jgi:hypothetical protein
VCFQIREVERVLWSLHLRFSTTTIVWLFPGRTLARLLSHGKHNTTPQRLSVQLMVKCEQTAP